MSVENSNSKCVSSTELESFGLSPDDCDLAKLGLDMSKVLYYAKLGDELEEKADPNVVVFSGTRTSINQARRFNEVAEKVCSQCPMGQACSDFLDSRGWYGPITKVMEKRKKSKELHPSQGRVIRVSFGPVTEP